MITALDTNVLLDLLVPGALHADASTAKLERALADGSLVVCDVVYAELAAHFGSHDDLDRFLTRSAIDVTHTPRTGLYLGALAWRDHLRRRRRTGLRCPVCGERCQTRCQGCGEAIPVRQHILADFLIGGHAQSSADRLLTRDRGHYGRYFPDLRLGPGEPG